MRHTLITLGLSLTPLLAFGQNTVATPPPSPETTETAESRSSRAMGSALTAGIKYSPPPPEPEKKEPVEAEKPKNEIVRLPGYVVQGTRSTIFSEQALRDQKERGKFAVKKYLSELDRGVLNRVSGPAWSNFSNEKRAEQMARDDDRLKTIETIDEQSLMYQATGDERRAKEAQEDKSNLTLRNSLSSGPRDRNTWYGETR